MGCRYSVSDAGENLSVLEAGSSLIGTAWTAVTVFESLCPLINARGRGPVRSLIRKVQRNIKFSYLQGFNFICWRFSRSCTMPRVWYLDLHLFPPWDLKLPLSIHCYVFFFFLAVEPFHSMEGRKCSLRL